MSKPTIADVAELAGVSPTTVSLYINRRGGISVATEARIADAIETLDYVPRGRHGRRRSTEAGFIGLLVEKLPTLLTGDPFYADVASGIQSEAEKLGYSIAVNVISEATQDLPRLVAENSVQGILALGGGDINDELLRRISASRTPLVTVDNQVALAEEGYDDAASQSNLAPIDSVVVDNYRGAYQAVHHLHKLGHRRIAIITGPRKYKSLTERYHGYLAAMQDCGLGIDAELVQAPISRGRPNKGFREMQALLALPKPPTAVFAVSDRTALGAIPAISAAGLAVPDEISIVGFDDMPPYAYPPPSLSSVTSERLKMGHIAMQRLHQIIEDPSLVAIQIVMPSQLVLRDSSAPPRYQ